jgi:hypothetical protein
VCRNHKLPNQSSKKIHNHQETTRIFKGSPTKTHENMGHRDISVEPTASHRGKLEPKALLPPPEKG